MQHIGQIGMLAVSQNHVGQRLERRQVAHHRGLKKIVARQGRLIHHHRNAFGLDALHDALNALARKLSLPCFMTSR